MNEVKKPKKPLIYYYFIVLLIIILFNLLLMPQIIQRQIKETDYGTFMTMTEEKNIGRVQVQDNQIVFTDKEEKNIYKTGLMNDPELVQRLKASGAEFSGEIIEETSPLLSILLTWILPMVIFIVLGQIISKKMMEKAGGANSMAFNLGKSNAKVYVKSSDGIKFSDVAGEDEAKENLTEIVEYLHNPDKYKEIGASMPKGILLVGPPGTGKTMLAKAVAGEANVPFFSMSGSEFVEMFVGMGASKVRDLFKQAKEKAPCIVFIDEIDAIGQKRSSGKMGGNDEREQTLNQLLTEMDGFEGNSGVIILAATNRPESLDAALTRPGRFDRRVPVELPDLKGREEILKVHAKKIKVAENVDFHTVARMASGASGAELANIVNEAALRAVRDGRKCATQEDLEESIEVVIAGYQKKNAILTDHEKMVVSYHEIGHALVAAKQTNSAPVQKITIVPRTSGALGYTMQVDEGNHYLMTKEELENKIATYTGGRAAEEIVFKSVSTGASNDIEQATKLARAMLTRYGMSDDFGMVAFETVSNQYLGGEESLICSAELQAKIDYQVIDLVKTQHEKARRILTENREKLDELAKFLYEKETITGEEFMEILNK
ncbi:MAG: ATP-dependent zinc metalloprotease FtsH [Eubacteriales bacterium]|nr:ATP-dependent zinc metalloprotease FtsH [Eubacteriales bacterium]